jgi:hypothetical protein
MSPAMRGTANMVKAAMTSRFFMNNGFLRSVGRKWSEELFKCQKRARPVRLNGKRLH